MLLHFYLRVRQISRLCVIIVLPIKLKRENTMKRKIKITLKIICSIVTCLVIISAGFLTYVLIKKDAPAFGYYFDDNTQFDLKFGQTVEMKETELSVLLLTDMHYNGFVGDRKTDELADYLVEKTKPDLIILLGDNCFTPFNQQSYEHIIKKMDSYKIPWALIFGNHDEQGKATKQYLAKMLEESSYSIFCYGPNNIDGAGNYFINITKDETIVHTIYLLDSKKKSGNYQPPSKEQIKWYEWAVNGITDYCGKVVPSTLLIHIPLPEYIGAYDAAITDNSVIYGNRGENEAVSNINSGLFEKIKKLKSTVGIFCGHDHLNDYSVMSDGVRLTYSVSSGFGSYGSNDIKGGTLLKILQNGQTEQTPLYYK